MGSEQTNPVTYRMAAASAINIGNLARITPTDLAALLLDPACAAKVVVVDVRDSDHLGGHIKGSIWVPTAELDARIPELMRMHQDKDTIVFHCMLSQQRGPVSAIKFARALEAAANKGQAQQTTAQRPAVCVLEGGFGMWQARYGSDERLTDAYVKDLWD